MTHHPTLDAATYTCPACPWRAVLTTDGRIVQTTAGDAGHDHIGQARAEQAQRIAFAAQAIARVKRQYSERAVFEGHTLSLDQLQHLYRAIIGEHR